MLWGSSCPWEPIRWHGSPMILKYHPYWYNKNDFSLYYTTLYLLLSFKSMIYSLVREHGHFNHTKRNWFSFILMLSDQNEIGLKYEPSCFFWFLLTVDIIFSAHPVVWWFHFTIKLRLLLSLFESPYFDWELFQGFC